MPRQETALTATVGKEHTAAILTAAMIQALGVTDIDPAHDIYEDFFWRLNPSSEISKYEAWKRARKKQEKK